MLVRCVQPTAVQRAYPFLRTERTHGLSSRICKHQFSDWTSLQVKGSLSPNTHVNSEVGPYVAIKRGLRAAAGVIRRLMSVVCR